MTKKNDKNQKGFDKKTLLTGIVAIISIFIISFVANAAITANFVYEQQPCKLVKCQTTPEIQAKQIEINPSKGTILCQCPNTPQINYEISKVRM